MYIQCMYNNKVFYLNSFYIVHTHTYTHTHTRARAHTHVKILFILFISYLFHIFIIKCYLYKIEI